MARSITRRSVKAAIPAIQRVLSMGFRIVPYRLSFFGLVILSRAGLRGSTTMSRAFIPILARGLMRRPDLRVLSPLAAIFPNNCQALLLQLGLYRELIEFIWKRGAAIRSLEAARMLAMALFETEMFEQVFQVLSPWFDSPEFRSRPELLQMRGLLELMFGREDDAIDALTLAAAGSPRLLSPHQNLAARSPYDYMPNTLDYEAGGLGRVYDAANFLGQRVTHVGAGHRGIPLYARALAAQKTLRASLPELSAELKILLHELQIEVQELRILPPEWVTQIGHEAMLDILFRMRELGWWQGKAVVLAPPGLISNWALLSLVKDFCHVLIPEIDLSTELYDELISLQRYLGMSFNAFELPSGKVVPWQEAGALAIRQWEAEGRRDILRDAYDRVLDPGIIQSADAIKRQWGMKPNDWFVCLHIRDAGHYGETGFTGQGHRNAGVGAYVGAVNHITKQGGWVIKLGGPAAPSLPHMERVIEYGRSSFKSEMMDLCLIRHCRYFIGTTSGLTNVAISFGIPSALVNCITTDAQLWGNRVRFILKKVRKPDGHLITQREFTSTPWRWRMFEATVLWRHRAVLIENSSEEVLEVVKEVEALANNLRQGGRAASREPESIEKWRRSLAFEHFYGNARPCLAYLQADENEFHEKRGADEAILAVTLPDQTNSAIA